MSESQDKTGQPIENSRQVTLQGGVYIQGDVNTGGGDFIHGDKHVFISNDPEAVRERRRQMLLLEHVRRFWLDDYLTHSLLDEVFFDLGRQDQPKMVKNAWEGVTEKPAGSEQPDVAGANLREVFEQAGNSLLLLGAPGSGKTIALLKLAEALVERAAKDPAQPVPVVLNLSTWGEKEGGFADWVVGELNDKYKVNRDLGRQWLENDDLLLLLDGLDEVRPERQAACVQVINAFRREHGMTGLAVCCRIEEYLLLPEKLDLGGALQLLPLSAGQVEAYLTKGGERLAALRQAIGEDDVLRELASTPLMLSVMSLAYRDLPAEALALVEAGAPARRSHLFNTYIERMFERHGKESRYPRQQVMGWLGWLARGMQAHSQSIFMLDDLQPSWLGSAPGRWGYLLLTRPLWGGLWGALNGAALALGALWVAVRGLGMSEASQFSYGLGLVAMLAGLFAMLGGLAGLAQALANGARMQRRARRAPETIPAQASRSETLVDFIANGAPPGLVTGGFLALFVAGLAQIGRLIAGQDYTGFEWAVWLQLVALGAAAALMVFGLSWGSSGVDYRADIRLVEILQWSWSRAGRGVLWGGLAGLAAGLVFGWMVGAFDSSLLWPVVLLCGAPLGLVGAGVFGLAAGLRGRSVEVQITPDSGIRRSVRYAALSGLLMGLGGAGLAVIAMGLSLWLVGRAVPSAQGNTGLVDFGLVFSLLAGVQIAFIGMMRTGGLATLQHGLLFALLAAGGHLPWRLIRFLDYAADLILVHRVGGGYVFTHRLLMEHILMPASPNQPAVVGEEHPPGQQ